MRRNIEILKDALDLQFTDNDGNYKSYISPSGKDLIVLIDSERYHITTSPISEKLFDIELESTELYPCLTIAEVFQKLECL